MKRVLFILMGVALLGQAAAQKMVYLEHCEALSFDQKRSNAQLLTGNVRFRHEGARVYCDSAYFYEQTNSLDAFGHVRFVQGDTLEGVGDKMHYEGNTRMLRLYKNVVLTNLTTVLTTDELFYDRLHHVIYYLVGGTIRDGKDELTSVRGYYNEKSKIASFRNKVHLHNDQFILDTDSLRYLMAERTVEIVLPTKLVYEDETTILSSDGWYNTETGKSMLFSKSTITHQNEYSLTGDTIAYDRSSGIGTVRGHMKLNDQVKKLSLFGRYGIMYEKEKRGFATGYAYLEEWSQPNRSYTNADTIFTEPIDSNFHRVRAFHNVRTYSKDYQFVCDSMVYNGKDSIVTMYYEPVLWSDSDQFSADTMFIIMNDSTIDYLRGVGSALGIKQEGENEFDQMSGKEMKAYVRNGALSEIHVSGNVETIYYPRNEDSTFVGVNKLQSSDVNIFVVDNKIHHILFTTVTTGTLYPLDQISAEDTKLTGFFWATQERPVSPPSIFARPKRTPRPTQKAISATEDEKEDKVTTKTTTKRNRKEK